LGVGEMQVISVHTRSLLKLSTQIPARESQWYEPQH